MSKMTVTDLITKLQSMPSESVSVTFGLTSDATANAVSIGDEGAVWVPDHDLPDKTLVVVYIGKQWWAKTS